MKDCPKCDGIGFDYQDGEAYSCYFCGESGRVSDEIAAEYEAAMQDRYEYRPLRPQYIGIYDEHSGDVFFRRRSLLPATIIPRQPVPALAYDDDIPF